MVYGVGLVDVDHTTMSLMSAGIGQYHQHSGRLAAWHDKPDPMTMRVSARAERMVRKGTHTNVVEVEVVVESGANALLSDLPNLGASKRSKEGGGEQNCNTCRDTSGRESAGEHYEQCLTSGDVETV